MISITNHRIDPTASELKFSYDESPNHSGLFRTGTPDTLVMHFTLGDTYTSSVNWLKNPNAKASAHLVVGRKGEVVQLVPFNQIAWHAGASQWNGRSGLNNYSIGIEIANAGILSKRSDGYYTTFGKRIDNDQVVLAPHKNGGPERAWEAYTPTQMAVVEQLCEALIANYPISELVGHDDIAPGRKFDPGPAFPIESLRSKILFGRKDEEERTLDRESRNKGIVTAELLNLRQSPSLNAPTVTEPLRQGTRFEILKIEGDWVKVDVCLEGWVSRKHIKYFE